MPPDWEAFFVYKYHNLILIIIFVYNEKFIPHKSCTPCFYSILFK
jgi:hypothetical protein